MNSLGEIIIVDYQVGVDILNFPIISRHFIVRTPDENGEINLKTDQSIVRVGMSKIRRKSRLKTIVSERHIGIRSFVKDCMLFQSKEPEHIWIGVFLYLWLILIWSMTEILIRIVQ